MIYHEIIKGEDMTNQIRPEQVGQHKTAHKKAGKMMEHRWIEVLRIVMMVCLIISACVFVAYAILGYFVWGTLSACAALFFVGLEALSIWMVRQLIPPEDK